MQSDDIGFRDPKPFYKLLDNYAQLLKEVIEPLDGDVLETRLQRRTSKPYMSLLPPAKIYVPSDYRHISIFCVQHPNTKSNVYEFSDKQEHIVKDISQGFMFSILDPCDIVITPSPITIMDPFEGDAHEDVVIMALRKSGSSSTSMFFCLR